MIRKAAKTLSVAVVVMGALATVIVTGWIVLAQEVQPPPTDEQLKAQIAALIEQGKALEANGDYAGALAVFQQTTGLDPQNTTAVRNIGLCLEMQGDYAQALGYYQQAVALGKGTAWALDHGDGEAWYGCIVCYKEFGDQAKITEAVQKLKTISLISPWTIKAMGIQAEMAGQPEAEVQDMMTREQEAADLYRQAADTVDKTLNKDKKPEVIIPLFDRVIEDYPETGGALSAMLQKADLLRGFGQSGKAAWCYELLLASKVWQEQPPSGKLRRISQMIYARIPGDRQAIDARVAEIQADQLLRQIVQKQIAGQPVEAEQWDSLNVSWDRWMQNADGPQKADAAVFQIMVSYVQGKYAEVVDAVSAYLAEYRDTEPSRMEDVAYKGPFASAYMLAGLALRQLGRPDEAVKKYRAIIDMAGGPQPLPLEDPRLSGAYFHLCWSLKAMGAPREQILQVIDQYFSLYTNDSRVAPNEFASLKKLRDRLLR